MVSGAWTSILELDLSWSSECRHIINSQGEHGGKEALAAHHRMKGCRITYVYHCRAPTLRHTKYMTSCHAKLCIFQLWLHCYVRSAARRFGRSARLKSPVGSSMSDVCGVGMRT